jgi:hypothetical protein
MSFPNSSTGMSRTRSGRNLGTEATPEGTERTPSPIDPHAGDAGPNLADDERPLPNVNGIIDPATFQQQMFAMMNLLTQSMAQQNRQSVQPAQVRAQEPKVKDPETFHGQRDSLNAFITECELVFELQASRFGDDRTKVSYMVSLLRGTPLLAVRPLLSFDPRPIILDNHRSFVQYLQTNYGDPDERGTARRKLKALRQNGPASSYFAELQQYIAVLGWVDQDPIIDRAIDGLKPYLKDEIARAGHRPQTLVELVAFVVPLDNRLYEREQERRHETRNAPTSRTTTAGPRPQDRSHDTVASVTTGTFTPRQQNVGDTRPSRPTYPSNNVSAPRGLLSDAEKQRRRDHNLCLRCGQPGHIANQCVTGRPAQGTTVQVKPEPRNSVSPGNFQGPTS